jgi:hypothetical protein
VAVLTTLVATKTNGWGLHSDAPVNGPKPQVHPHSPLKGPRPSRGALSTRVPELRKGDGGDEFKEGWDHQGLTSKITELWQLYSNLADIKTKNTERSKGIEAELSLPEGVAKR